MLNCKRCSKCNTFYPSRTRNCKNAECNNQELDKVVNVHKEQRESTSFLVRYVEEEENAPHGELRYTHVQCNDHTARKVLVSESVICNPASKDNIIRVLRGIGINSSIDIYGQGDRKWTMVCCDNFRYYIILRLKKTVFCAPMIPARMRKLQNEVS